MIAPAILSWVKEWDDLLGFRVKCFYGGLFVPVAGKASKCQITQEVTPLKMTRKDMIYHKVVRRVALLCTTVLATKKCALSDGSAKRLRDRPCHYYTSGFGVSFSSVIT